MSDTYEKERTISAGEIRGYLEAYNQLISRYFFVLVPLVASAVPQAVLYSSFLSGATPRLRLVWAFIVQVPWLVYFGVTFIRVPPPVMPHTFRRIILFIVYWYATSIIVLAILAAVRHGSVSLSDKEIALWMIGTLLGLVGVPSLLRCSRALGELRTASAAEAN